MLVSLVVVACDEPPLVSRARQLVVVVKTWAKARRINSAQEGTLNSFGFSLLVIHYLQRWVHTVSTPSHPPSTNPHYLPTPHPSNTHFNPPSPTGVSLVCAV